MSFIEGVRDGLKIRRHLCGARRGAALYTIECFGVDGDRLETRTLSLIEGVRDGAEKYKTSDGELYRAPWSACALLVSALGRGC